MNNYYFVIRKLHSDIYKKRTTKEIWGAKTTELRVRFVFLFLLVLGMLGVILFIKVLWIYIVAMIILFALFLFAVRSLIKFTDKYAVDISKNRFTFIRNEVQRFSISLKEYGFDSFEIKSMIIQIERFNREKIEKSKRKYDVFWGVCSITFISFSVSVGKSIWESYGLKEGKALQVGLVVLLTAFSILIAGVLLASTIYNTRLEKVTIEEKIKLALEDVLYMNSGSKLLYEENEIL